MFLVSGPELVIAQCISGVIGSFPALNARPASELDSWLSRIEAARADHDRQHPDRPSAPFAVNLIVHRTNPRLEEDLATVVRHRVPIVITSLGAQPHVNEAVHAYGGIVLHDVVNNHFAHKAIEKGADGLIAVAAGAGGHAGTTSPFALVQEIREWFDGPLVLGGAIASGRAILAAQVLGADLAYVGSAFIPAEESAASDAYKQMVVDSSSADVVYTPYFTGVAGNYLRPSIAAAGISDDEIFAPAAAGLSYRDGNSKSRAWKDIWGSGQGIGGIRESRPTAEIVDALANEYAKAVAGVRSEDLHLVT